MRRLALAVGVVAVAALAATCSDQTQERAAEAARATGAAVESAASDAVRNAERASETAPAEAVKAAIETVDVKAALMADSRVDASNINVDTDHRTKTVTLKGRVPSDAQKTTAGEIATAKAAGYTVNNELEVR
jgi:hyperosmotically inducible periplasmic protein